MKLRQARKLLKRYDDWVWVFLSDAAYVEWVGPKYVYRVHLAAARIRPDQMASAVRRIERWRRSKLD